MRPVDKLLPRLNKVRSAGRDKWQALCPAHDDKNPSLSIKETPDGTVLIKCWCGCNAADICAAVGLTLRDLFPESGGQRGKPIVKGFTRRELEEALEIEKAILYIAGCDIKNGTFKESDNPRIDQASKRVLELSRRLASCK